MKKIRAKAEKEKPEKAMQKKASIKKKTTGQKVQNKNEKKLRILILEDILADAELMERQLKKDGINFTARRVDSRNSYLKALKAFEPDLILADYNLPKFSALQALELRKKTAPLTPFIIVTGTISEEIAVECLKLGADDYILKDRLSRLGEAVRHALANRRLQADKMAAEKQIEQAARKWTITFDSIKDGIALLAVDQTVMQANRAFADLAKKPFKQIIGKKCYELIHSNRMPHPQCPFRKMLKSKKRESIELALADRMFEVIVDPITDDAGTISGAVHIMTDVTERKRNEAALWEMSEIFRLFLKHSPIYVFIKDENIRPIYLSENYEKMLGRPLEKILGKSMDELFPSELSRTMIEDDKKILRDGKPREFIEELNGRIYSTLKFPITINGVAKYLAGYTTDITERKKMEDELKNSESRYHNLFENSGEFFYTLDLKGNFTDVNKAALSLTGYTKSELLKMNFKDYTPKRDHRKLFLALSNIYKTEKPLQNFLVEAVIKDKSIKYFETSISLMKKDEQIIGYQGSSKDITERKRAEEALKQSEKDYRNLFDNATDAIYIQDKKGRFLDVNQGAVDMYGYPKEFFIGKTPGFLSAPGKNDMKKIIGFVEDAFNGKPRQYDFWGIRKNGEVFPKFVRSQQGFYLGQKSIITSAIDITERKKAEDALRESEEKYRTLVDNIQDGIFIIQGIEMQFVNESFTRMVGYTVEEVIGMDFRQLVAPEDLEMVTTRYRRRQAGKEVSREYEFHALHKDGKTRVLVNMTVGLVHYRGRVASMGTVKDITERKKAEEQIRASLKEKEVLLQEIHHRVKNNLQIISGLLTLQAAQTNDERLQRMLKESQSRIWTMTLIHQTLYQSGNLADIDMADYIRSLAGNLLSSHAQAAMPPTVRFDLVPLRLVIDKAIPLALIINELVTNALKHAFPDGRPGEIRIALQERRGTPPYGDKSRRAPNEETDVQHEKGTTRRAPTYELTVADNGAGLPAGFDLKSLGLQLVAMLAKQLGGSMAIEQKGGAVFRVIFNNNEKSKKQS